MSRSRLIELVGAVALMALVGTTARAADSDPLARPEFDLDVTLKIADAPVLRVYETLARIARVPFILAFDQDDPSLKVTFKAENMGIRALLAEVAKTYDLEYSSADGGILVTRKGQPPTEERRTVGPWRESGPQYRFKFLIRDKDGKVLSTPAITTRINQPLEVKQGVRIGGPVGDAFLAFQLVPQRETENGLEFMIKWEEHFGATKTVGQGETVLFTTREGHEVVLREWSRRTETP